MIMWHPFLQEAQKLMLLILIYATFNRLVTYASETSKTDQAKLTKMNEKKGKEAKRLWRAEIAAGVGGMKAFLPFH